MAFSPQLKRLLESNRLSSCLSYTKVRVFFSGSLKAFQTPKCHEYLCSVLQGHRCRVRSSLTSSAHFPFDHQMPQTVLLTFISPLLTFLRSLNQPNTIPYFTSECVLLWLTLIRLRQPVSAMVRPRQYLQRLTFIWTSRPFQPWVLLSLC